MAVDKRRGSLLKASQAVEREASVARKNVEEVCAERERKLKALEDQLRELEDQRTKLLLRMKQQSLQNGDLAELSSLSSYDLRIEAEIGSIKVQIAEQKIDLDRARERGKLAQADETAAYVERKKMEYLVDLEMQGQRVIQVASEEALDDELLTAKKKD